ncbi:hypothetical protein CLOL250_00820 [Clostridium sp. L2-50]|nr:hypothetical protein CLOL250_00820 [Clostridium sp. L2-50]
MSLLNITVFCFGIIKKKCIIFASYNFLFAHVYRK